jgi:hypothetical protein
MSFEDFYTRLNSIENETKGTLSVGNCKASSQGKEVVVGMYVKSDGVENCIFGHTTNVTGKNNIVIGNDLKIIGNDQIIIGRIDLINLLNRIEELEMKVEHLWLMPGGPEFQKAKLHFESLI